MDGEEMDEIINEMRWENYFLRRGMDFKKYWKEFLASKQRDVCYILGLGFDPRMCSAIDYIIKCDGEGIRDCYLIKFNEGETSQSKNYEPEIAENEKKLTKIMSDRGRIIPKEIEMISSDRRRIGGRAIIKCLNDVDFSKYSDIIVDISALPRPLYFPIIRKFLHEFDEKRKNGQRKFNLHIIIVENPKLDSLIKALGVEDKADYIVGFRGRVELESTGNLPTVWIPILGEGKAIQLDRIYTLVRPQEICPVLPFPALNPRRGDDIIIEYREMLFDNLRIDPVNILYASEQNPFEVYRKIVRTVSQYHRTLNVLGGCKIVVSILSSKLLSMGALLAVYDISEDLQPKIPIAIAHVESQGYELDPFDKDEIMKHEELYSMWLAGECYDD
ncbi:MAG: hypothetical protein ABFC71_03110 [Methanoregula sp.]